MLERSRPGGVSETIGSDAPAGIHSLDHFAFDVPDPNEAAQFYSDFRLEVKRVADQRLELYTLGNQRSGGRRRPLNSLIILNLLAVERAMFDKTVKALVANSSGCLREPKWVP